MFNSILRVIRLNNVLLIHGLLFTVFIRFFSQNILCYFKRLETFFLLNQIFMLRRKTKHSISTLMQGCRPRGCRGCQFWQISLPYLNQGGRLCPPNNTGTPGFSYLLNLLHVHSSWSFSISISLVRWVSAINSMMIPFRTLFSFFGSCIFSRQNQNCFQIQIFRCHIVLAFTFKIRSISWLLRQNLSSK